MVALLALGVGVLGGMIVTRVLATVLGRASPERATLMGQRLGGPCVLATPLLILDAVDPAAAWARQGPTALMAAKAEHIALIVAVAWLIMRLLSVAETLLVARLEAAQDGGPALRKARTQISLLRKFLAAVIAVVSLALILMSFTAIRHVGTSLLASAGAAGVIFGIAAQRSIGNVVAGFQILFTQTLRIDDAVVVEGEWGTVEELALTFVVVRLWDLRRLVLPITYFIEKPFQNWTRTSTKLLGTVFLWVDLEADVAELRRMFLEIVEKSPSWDRSAARLQVTDVSETAIQVRCLVSASDAGALWDLRCDVREQLLARLRVAGRAVWPTRRLRDTAGSDEEREASVRNDADGTKPANR